MSVGHGPGHHPDGSHGQGEGGPGGHQQHHAQRRDQQLTHGPQGVPPPGQLIKQTSKERGRADPLGDQRPAPQAQQFCGQGDSEDNEREDLLG
mgnify:CR=1 FL=1